MDRYVSLPTLVLGAGSIALFVVLSVVGRGRAWAVPILLLWGLVAAAAMWAIAGGGDARSLVLMLSVGILLGGLTGLAWSRHPPR